MGRATSPSPIVSAFVRALERDLPAEQRAKLAAHEEAIAATSDAEDGRRARHCAVWAIHLADGRDVAHPRWAELKETHQVWKDMWLGFEFGVMGDGAGPPEPIRDVEIEWVEDAVTVARIVGEAEGWDHAPWEDLLVELIAMEPKSADASG